MNLKQLLKPSQFIIDSKDNDDINSWFLSLDINTKRRIYAEKEEK